MLQVDRKDFTQIVYQPTDYILDFITPGSSVLDIYDRNPITEELRRNPYFYSQLKVTYPKMSISAVTKAFIQCQMIVLQNRNGVDGDGEDKGLRRSWYQFQKIDFAQAFADSLNKWEREQGNWNKDHHDKRWDALFSVAYGWWVDEMGVTYHDLWVKDTSRMMDSFEEELFENANIFLAVEKDSLYQDFVQVAKSLGAKGLISGSGQPSKASVELLLHRLYGYGNVSRDENWEIVETAPTYNWENPIIILSITDYDKAGHIISNAFLDQVKRYTHNVQIVRVGINPYQVKDAGEDLQEKAYQLHMKDKGDFRFAEQKGMIYTECDCGRKFTNARECYTCGQQLGEPSDFMKGAEVYGYEVEAINTIQYRRYIVGALLEAIDYDTIILKLRHETVASAFSATWEIKNWLIGENENMLDLQLEIQRLQAIRDEFLYDVERSFMPLAESHKGDFFDEGEDPEQEKFFRHVEQARGIPWRPFSETRRTELLVEKLKEDYEELIDKYKERKIEW